MKQTPLETLYWLSDVMTAGDEMKLTPAQVKDVEGLVSMLELDPRYKYELSGMTVKKRIK